MYPLFESPSSWGPQPSPTQWVGWGEEEQGSGLCDDEGDVAQYLGMDAFFNLK